MGRARSVPRLSDTLLSDPADILPKMPAQALSPALFELLNLMSGPVLLIEDSTAGEPRRRRRRERRCPRPRNEKQSHGTCQWKCNAEAVGPDGTLPITLRGELDGRSSQGRGARRSPFRAGALRSRVGTG